MRLSQIFCNLYDLYVEMIEDPAVSHPLTYSSRYFFEKFVCQIPGWLEDVAALRSMDFLGWQEESAITGPLLEIGVFHGRYFSILARSAGRQGSRIVGVDTFQWIDENKVWENLNLIRVDKSLVKLEKAKSTDLGTGDVISLCGGKPRFISVDGSHDYSDVFYDLQLVEAVLASKGIAALDDFLNPLTLGVNEAINQFFSTPRNLKPFAYIRNKLFVCRPSMHETLAALTKSVTLADKEDPASISYCKKSEKTPNDTSAKMWGTQFELVL